MDMYELGRVAIANRDQVVGYTAPEKSLIVSPGAIKSEMEKVLREGETLDRDISSYNSSTTSFVLFKKGWTDFWSAYKKFYADNGEGISGWFSRFSASMGNQVVAYGNQLNDWRTKFRSFGGAVATEPAIVPVQHRDDPTNKKIDWKPVVIGSVVVAGLFGGGYALSKLGVFAGMFARKKQ